MKTLLKKIRIKHLVIIGSFFGIILIALLIIFININTSQERKLENKMIEMGKTFYEEYYYDVLTNGRSGEKKEALFNNYKTVGFKVNLDNLSRALSNVGSYKNKKSDEILSDFVNIKTNEKCDVANSEVTIFPKEPYNKDSYEIKIKLKCGFN